MKGLQAIGYDTIAAGDSYNDLGMIQASKAGFLFRSTEKIKADYPELPAFEDLEDPQDVYRMVQQVVLDIQTDIEYPNAYRPAENPGYNTNYRP